MTPEKLISSGLLESYALGELSGDEVTLVEGMLEKHTEVRAELERIELVFEELAMRGQIAPPSNVRANILSVIDVEGNVSVPDKRNDPAQNSRSTTWMVAASVAALLFSGVLNLYLLSEMGELRKQVSAMQDDRAVFAQQVNDLETSLKNSKSELTVLTDPSRELVELEGLDISPGSAARVYWNSTSKEVHIAVFDLPVPPDNKQYQLWAIVDGVPINAGMLPVELNFSQLYKMASFSSAQAFAITLEPEGGSVDPTLDQMFVVGEVEV